MLAYRNIKNNTGSHTAGTDGITIDDIKKMTTEEVTAKVRYIVSDTKRNYKPKLIRNFDRLIHSSNSWSQSAKHISANTTTDSEQMAH